MHSVARREQEHCFLFQSRCLEFWENQWEIFIVMGGRDCKQAILQYSQNCSALLWYTNVSVTVTFCLSVFNMSRCYELRCSSTPSSLTEKELTIYPDGVLPSPHSGTLVPSLASMLIISTISRVKFQNSASYELRDETHYRYFEIPRKSRFMLCPWLTRASQEILKPANSKKLTLKIYNQIYIHNAYFGN